jgi:hypothetical protein
MTCSLLSSRLKKFACVSLAYFHGNPHAMRAMCAFAAVVASTTHAPAWQVRCSLQAMHAAVVQLAVLAAFQIASASYMP